MSEGDKMRIFWSFIKLLVFLKSGVERGGVDEV